MYIISTFMIGLVNLLFWYLTLNEVRMGFDKRWQHNQSFQNIFVIYHNWYYRNYFLDLFEAIPEYLVRLSQALPFFWMFYAFNPSKVLSNIERNTSF